MNLLAVAIWIAVLVSSALLITGLRRARSAPAGPAAGLHDLSEAAFVVGGPGTVVDAALVSMLGDGRLVAGGPGIVQVRPGARAADPAERAVLQAHRGAPSGWLYQVRYAAMCDPAVQEIGDALAARGLITPPGSGLRRFRRWGLIQALVCALLFPVSMVLTFVALAVDSGSAVPFIVKVIFALVGGIVVGLVCAAGAKSRVTGAGARALRAVRSAHLNDRTPHVQTALFGLRGLRDPYLRQQLVPAARGTRLAAAQSRPGSHGTGGSAHWSGAEVLPIVWCAGSDGGSGGGGGSSCGSGSGCGGSTGCGSSGGGCGSSGGGSSCSSSSSSCGSSSSSSCGSSSSSSCGSSSS
ncbi:TIGR04222 domain-containing membrane protein [Streptomyces sp. NPDC006459]|uniref:TIGR04222 domain-containing membrane protein n=1 Tax=Streptomyces sp. NPDC006459 TaxID=3154303 RepID=UPI0033A930A9